jgi:hypothetical protein
LWGNLERSDHLGDIDIDGKMILKWNLKKWDIRIWTEFIWLMHIGMAGPCGSSNEPFMKAEYFLDQLSDFYLLTDFTESFKENASSHKGCHTHFDLLYNLLSHTLI